jgi:hypothetical protein
MGSNLSSKRIAANRRNARKSTGPRTTSGKARSRMNALKHGLDARTLILPGEDEAAYRARLDAFQAEVRPRNSLEESLVERAARLSWQVDRADRVQAAHLIQRIRLAQDPESLRQRAEAEAAEAAEVGRRLLDGPPAPTFDLKRIGDRLARLAASPFWSAFTPVGDVSRLVGKRLAMPMHPDDPEHPARLLRQLESTGAGCRWLLDRWAELRAALEEGAGGRPAQRLAAVRLLGREPADAVDDPMVQAIYLCSFVLGSNDPRVLADQAQEMTNREFDHFLQRLAGRGVQAWLPSSWEAASEGLLALVDVIIANLGALSAAHTARSEASTRPDRLGFDTTPEGERLVRLQVRLHNSLLRTIDLLWKIRRDPKARESGRVVAPSPALTQTCVEIRNEPKVEAGPVIAVGQPVSRPPSDAVVTIRDQASAAAPGLAVRPIRRDGGLAPSRGAAKKEIRPAGGFPLPEATPAAARRNVSQSADPGRSRRKDRHRRSSTARPPPR